MPIKSPVPGTLLTCAVVLALTLAFLAFWPRADAAAAGLPAPATHDKNWITGHAAYGKTQARDCAVCHDQSYCTACHNSANPLEGYHKPNYASTHYLDKFLDERECASCHDNQTFCVACHRQHLAKTDELKPLYHNDPTWTSSLHSKVARDDLDACIACHETSEPTCLNCHRNVNPHADMTTIRNMGKGPWHDDKGYICYRCHNDNEEFCSLCHDDGEGPERTRR